MTMAEPCAAWRYSTDMAAAVHVTAKIGTACMWKISPLPRAAAAALMLDLDGPLYCGCRLIDLAMAR